MKNSMRTSNGIPLIGFGTFPLRDGAAERAVSMALEEGFRHIDTAQIYGNEKPVGRAFKSSGLVRGEVFVVTKVDPGNLGAAKFLASVETSIADLGGPADLLLIHWPPPESEIKAVIGRLVEAHRKGLASHIGISNFPTALMRRAAALSPVRLIANQVEFHPLIDQAKVLTEARALGMTLTAYSPLARGLVLKEAVIQAIARKHGRPPSEIALRWIVQQGVAAIPMTTRRENAQSNLRVLHFTLPEEDMAAISALTARHHRVITPASMAGRWDT